jgi:adenylate cyclase
MYRMNPLTLSFTNNNEELYFREEYVRKIIKPTRIVILVGLVVYASFGVLDKWIEPESVLKLWFIRYVIGCSAILVGFFCTFTPYFRKYSQEIVSVGLLIASLCIVAMIGFTRAPNNYYYYAGLMLMLLFSYAVVRLRFVYATTTALIVVLAYEVTAIAINQTPPLILISNNFFLITANIFCMFASYLMELYTRKEFVQRRLLEAEEQKSERLLLNILPKGIVERLKQQGGEANIKFSQVIVDSFSDVTVLFADIVEFTALSSRISPEALVVFLNELFSIFDNLAEKHGIVKIKTIGDAYMVVGGLPDPCPNHAEAIAEMALDMQEEVAKIESAKEGWLRIRIGIHTGSVVAGVIGRKTFSYDLWGNTVNVASRMEQNSVAGNILVSEETYRRLRNDYLLIVRGKIEVKGKGSMNTYFLAGRKPANVVSS